MARISRALDPDHKRIDREIWLHRLGDFMIEEIEPEELYEVFAEQARALATGDADCIYIETMGDLN